MIVYILASIAIVIIGWLYIRYKVRKSSILAANWARDHGYNISSIKELWFDRGPYFRWSTFCQIVFQLQLVDCEGYTRSCGMKLGHWLLGLFDSKIEIIWQEELFKRMSG